jgi:carbamoyltransferase
VNILGLSAFYHDSAACLVRDGQIIAAAQEELHPQETRAAFPKRAVGSRAGAESKSAISTSRLRKTVPQV